MKDAERKQTASGKWYKKIKELTPTRKIVFSPSTKIVEHDSRTSDDTTVYAGDKYHVKCGDTAEITQLREQMKLINPPGFPVLLAERKKKKEIIKKDIKGA